MKKKSGIILIGDLHLKWGQICIEFEATQKTSGIFDSIMSGVKHFFPVFLTDAERKSYCRRTDTIWQRNCCQILPMYNLF
ncbi:MAG: hypothetical protein A2Y10_04855 [Planctomycetes bacterium GWF2_41_51]|nr:MAG: hypothetical protein A2Y10_04855 [Planctomycetes bacterium GWF2_41_51]HBG26454.1 hypothetical protein [Phycisphaerales bacterium]